MRARTPCIQKWIVTKYDSKNHFLKQKITKKQLVTRKRHKNTLPKMFNSGIIPFLMYLASVPVIIVLRDEPG
jgi:hypothetical protein